MDHPGDDIATAELRRLAASADPATRWRRWGAYLSERQWGTVREDYSADGNAWEYLPHDHARSRAYRWGEDGILGICDDQARLCLALTLWNGADPILKERFFGVSGPEGNHGEDVKELYWYLDATPTHSYLRAAYAYPQRAYPYADLVAESRRRTKDDPEYELVDTGVLAEDRFFDIVVEYAKDAPEDIAIRYTVTNRGPEPATLHLLPTLWFRNTWAWGRHRTRPTIEDGRATWDVPSLVARHPRLGQIALLAEGATDLLFTDNETNAGRLFGAPTRALAQGRDRGGGRRRTDRHGQSGRHGVQGGGPVRARAGSRRDRDGADAAGIDRAARSGQPAGRRGSTGSPAPFDPRIRRPRPAPRRRRCGHRQPPRRSRRVLRAALRSRRRAPTSGWSSGRRSPA